MVFLDQLFQMISIPNPNIGTQFVEYINLFGRNSVLDPKAWATNGFVLFLQTWPLSVRLTYGSPSRFSRAHQFSVRVVWGCVGLFGATKWGEVRRLQELRGGFLWRCKWAGRETSPNPPQRITTPSLRLQTALWICSLGGAVVGHLAPWRRHEAPWRRPQGLRTGRTGEKRPSKHNSKQTVLKGRGRKRQPRNGFSMFFWTRCL